MTSLAEKAEETRPTSDPNDISLYELLQEERSWRKNYAGRRFICVEAVEQILDYSRCLQWIKSHPLDRSVKPEKDQDSLIYTILKSSQLFFALLVLAKKEYLFCTLSTTHNIDDNNLFDESFDQLLVREQTAGRLTREEISALFGSRKNIGAVIQKDRHQIFPQGTVLPYQNRGNRKAGSFGTVDCVTVAKGHLKGAEQV